MENGDPPVDGTERSGHWLENLESRFEKVTEAYDTSNKKVYDNMISVDADSQLLQVSNRKGKHESINKVPKLIDQKESS